MAQEVLPGSRGGLALLRLGECLGLVRMLLAFLRSALLCEEIGKVKVKGGILGERGGQSSATVKHFVPKLMIRQYRCLE